MALAGWQLNDRDRPALCTWLQLDAPAVGFDDPLGDGQPQAGARRTEPACLASAMEALEQQLLLLVLDPDPGVGDLDDGRMSFDAQSRRDRAAVRCVAGSVVEEDPEELAQPVRVALDHRRFDRGDRHVNVLRGLPRDAYGVNEQGIELDGLELDASGQLGYHVWAGGDDRGPGIAALATVLLLGDE